MSKEKKEYSEEQLARVVQDVVKIERGECEDGSCCEGVKRKHDKYAPKKEDVDEDGEEHKPPRRKSGYKKKGRIEKLEARAEKYMLDKVFGKAKGFLERLF